MNMLPIHVTWHSCLSAVSWIIWQLLMDFAFYITCLQKPESAFCSPSVVV